MWRHAKFRKIGQTVSEILRLFDFQDGRRPPSWILKFFNSWFSISMRGLRRITIPNFIKIGQTAAEVSHLFIKMVAVRHIGFVVQILG